MTDKERIKTIMRILQLPVGRHFVSGSGSMIMRDIEREKEMGDLDIFLATRDWFDLLYSGEWKVFTSDPSDPLRRNDPPYLVKVMFDLEVNIFSNWRQRPKGTGDIDVALWTHNAELIDGVPCVRLQFLFDWKRTVGRSKDISDVRILSALLPDA